MLARQKTSAAQTAAAALNDAFINVVLVDDLTAACQDHQWEAAKRGTAHGDAAGVTLVVNGHPVATHGAACAEAVVKTSAGVLHASAHTDAPVTRHFTLKVLTLILRLH